MPIDFFTAPCAEVAGNCKTAGIVCKGTTNVDEFGLCDDPPPATLPAYIDTVDKNKWIAIVNNAVAKDVTFKAVDHCVTILRPDGTRENRCDGLLTYDNNIIFVELKDRAYSGWLGGARNQLTKTINVFAAEYNIATYNLVEVYVSNKLKPLTNAAHNIEKQKFKDETGLTLTVQREIIIQ